jgi:hypothetical protein
MRAVVELFRQAYGHFVSSRDKKFCLWDEEEFFSLVEAGGRSKTTNHVGGNFYNSVTFRGLEFVLITKVPLLH